MPKVPKKPRIGRPPKSPGGLDKVLFVRATPELLAALDRIAAARSRESGAVVSRSDVARQLLTDAVKR